MRKSVVAESRMIYLLTTTREEESPVEDEPSEEESVDESSSSEESEPEAKHGAYNALLAAFGKSTEPEEPKRKKRKLDLNGSTKNPKRRRAEGLDQGDEANEVPEGSESEGPSDLAEEGESDAEELQGNVMGDEGGDDEDEEDATDPFEHHFANPSEANVKTAVNAIKDASWQTEKRPFGAAGICTVSIPQGAAQIAAKGKAAVKSLAELKLKRRLVEPANQTLGELSDLEKAAANSIFQYQDLLFGDRTVENSSRLRTLVTLHALNHVLKTRDRVIKHNNRLAHQKPSDQDIEYRDQGFTRPKVLVLLPTRHSCFRYVENIVSLFEPEQQENKKKFEETYVDRDQRFSEDRPADFRELFEGNSDDMFRLGIKFTRKTLQLFSPFYNSDIIIASPLGLRRAIEAGSDPKNKESNKKTVDYDFLSSIELLLLDQAEALIMQNWDHVDFIFDHLNLQPRESHGCDFSRVRNWYLDSQSQYLRQTIILSAFLSPDLMTLFSRRMLNISGKLRYAPVYAGEILFPRASGLAIKQTFSRYEAISTSGDPDARFDFFTKSIVPSLTRFPKPPDGAHGILIFIPSYFDYVRVRNYFANSAATANLSFSSVHENAGAMDRDIRRARAHLDNGRISVLLYTGRAHHFFRYRIKGVKKVIFYQLPDNPVFYRDIVAGFIGESVQRGKIGPDEASVRTVFSKFDAMRLERVVGSSRVAALLKNRGGDTFDFV
jgi:U3 small nucleolar RNA-associated protein 25